MKAVEQKYFDQMGEFATTESGRQVFRHMDIINIKTGSLLTHVSLMTAALGLFASRFIGELNYSLFEILILVELVVYVLISMSLLFCINITSPSTFYSNGNLQDGEYFAQRIVVIAARRRRIYNVGLRSTVGISILFLLTLFLKIGGLI
jgi:hypothetical protein